MVGREASARPQDEFVRYSGAGAHRGDAPYHDARLSAPRRASERHRRLWSNNLPSLGQLLQSEGGVAYNLTVDDDVHSLGADSHCVGTHVVDILAVWNPEIRAVIRRATVNGFVDRSGDSPRLFG
jgi:hypothetical protein